MTWNYALAACVSVLAFSIFNGYTVPAVFSGIALAAMIKVGAFKIVDRRKKHRSPPPQTYPKGYGGYPNE